jgi:large subunit ribosomal protein L10
MGVILVTHRGLTANQVAEFKQKLLDNGARFNVITNTLFKIALKGAELPSLDTLEEGPHAAIFAEKDIATAAKLLKDFIKENEDKIEMRAGIVEGQGLSQAQVQELAEMPSKEQSIAMIAGLLNQSLGGVINVLEDSVRSIAIIIEQAKK